MRVTCDHEYKNFLLDQFKIPHKILVPAKLDDPQWTEKFLAAFAQPNTDYYVDHDYPGWLVWTPEFPAYEADPKEQLQYDEIETQARSRIGSHMDKKWFNLFFHYLKQEPREGVPDRFRMASSMLLQFAFNLMRDGVAAASFEDVQSEIEEVFGDGSDKHQHRAAAEILGALVCSYRDSTADHRERMWAYVFPIIKQIFQDGLTPDNSSYWSSFLHLVLVGKLADGSRLC